MKNANSKKLTFGAMMIALFAILLVLAVYVPIVNIVAALFVVLPIAWYSALYDRAAAMFVAFGGLIVSFLIGGVSVLPLASLFIIVGLVIGDAIRRGKSKLYLFMSTSIISLLVVSIMYYMFVQFFEIDLVRESIAASQASYEAYSEWAKANLEVSPISEKQYDDSFVMLQSVIPALITLNVFFVVFLILSANLPVLRRLGLNVPRFAPFKDMRLPRSILWYYLVVLSVSLFGSPEKGSALYVILMNFNVVLWILLIMQGISLLFYYIHEKGLPNVLKALVVLFSVPLYSFVMLIGILDLGFNIRSYITGKNSK